MRAKKLVAAVLSRRPNQLALLMTAFGSIDLAVAAVRAGACGFIAKHALENGRVRPLGSTTELPFRSRDAQPPFSKEP